MSDQLLVPVNIQIQYSNLNSNASLGFFMEMSVPDSSFCPSTGNMNKLLLILLFFDVITDTTSLMLHGNPEIIAALILLAWELYYQETKLI